MFKFVKYDKILYNVTNKEDLIYYLKCENKYFKDFINFERWFDLFFDENEFSLVNEIITPYKFSQSKLIKKLFKNDKKLGISVTESLTNIDSNWYYYVRWF